MREPAAAARDWIRSAIVEERPQTYRPEELAEQLHSLAVEYDIAIEALIFWIHQHTAELPVSDWSNVCRHYCMRYAADQARLCGGKER